MKKNKYLSILLSFLFFGLGLVYNGKYILAIKLFSLYFLALTFIILFTPDLGIFFFYVGSIFIIFLYIYMLWLSFTTTDNTNKTFNRWFLYLLYYLSIFLIFVNFYAQAFRIPAGSMKNSFYIGDYIVAKKFAYGTSMPYIPFLEISIMPWSDKHRLIDGDTPKRGDIVIFRYPRNVKQHFVKRCVALPDDELFVAKKDLYVHYKEGDEWIKENFKEFEIVVLEGKLWVKNPYTKKHPGIHHDDKIVNNGRYPLQLFYFNPVKVEKDHYFMMGDNRDHSNDSRFWGSVPYDNIEGTPWFIYFSIDKNWEIRWDRMGKTPTDLEQSPYLDKAREERIRTDKDYHGIS